MWLLLRPAGGPYHAAPEPAEPNSPMGVSCRTPTPTPQGTVLALQLAPNRIKVTKDHFEAVGEAIMREAVGFGHNTFKIELARRAIVRALRHAARMERKP